MVRQLKMAFVVCVVLALASAPGYAALTIFDDFDGSSPTAPTWTNAADDSGEFALAAGGVYRGEHVAAPWWGRCVYSTFELSPAVQAAGYTLTVKGRGLQAPGGQTPLVSLCWATDNWDQGNWFYTGWGGANVMVAQGNFAAGQWLGGGGLAQIDTWYWMKVEVAAGGSASEMFVSTDGVSWNSRGTRNVLPYGNKFGVVTGNDSIAGTVSLITEYDWVKLESPIPEPGSLLALGAGLVSLGGFALRRRRA